MILNMNPVSDTITQRENTPNGYKTEKFDCMSLVIYILKKCTPPKEQIVFSSHIIGIDVGFITVRLLYMLYRIHQIDNYWVY